jgi:hypothetical protein
MTAPNPVFFESWLGYSNPSSSTTGIGSRWSGGLSNGSLIDIAPHRVWQISGASFERGVAALDTPILDGLFCLHMNLGSPSFLTPYVRNAVEITGADPTGFLLGFAINAGRVRISRNSFGTVLAETPPGSFPSSALHSVIVHGRIHPTLGEINVLINGFNVLSLTGIDTRGSAPDNEIHWIAVNDPYIGFTISHLGPIALFDDNVPMKPARFEPLYPNADGTPLDFVRDSGSSNFSRINEAVYGDVGFVSSSTPGARDVYELTDMGSPPETIYGVNLRANLHKLSSGTRIARLGVIDNAVSGWGEQVVLPASRISASRAVGKSPDTGVEFTFSQINALQLQFDISD